MDLTIPTIKLEKPVNRAAEFILSADALTFLYELHQRFNHQRLELLKKRKWRQAEFDKGVLPDFLAETLAVRQENWKIAPLPQDLLKRKVEITGPVDAKMIINALNSGADIFMSDFEDSNAPTWDNVVNGQLNLYQAIRGTLSYEGNGKTYKLNEKRAVLLVRPRGWHLEEKNLKIEGQYLSGALVDFGLYFFHNAKALIGKGSGPYFYLPKIESHLEARLWNEVFVFAQNYLGIPEGTIKATVLIETITAAFEMDEILYELREHSSGLNCGRWDYIFSFIKKFNSRPDFVLPDRSQVTMATHCMNSYAKLAIKTCHRRGAPAIGGMSAFIPVKNDEAANQLALQKVCEDKIREATNGHDGTWVAHPGLVTPVREIFDSIIPGDNQLEKQLPDDVITAEDLLKVPEGSVTEAGLRTNINVGILYIASWLRGVGAAAIYNLMEDAATAEISRAQVWQWLRHGVKLDDGRLISNELVHQIFNEEVLKIKAMPDIQAHAESKIARASAIFFNLINTIPFEEFLTLKAYSQIH